MKFCPVPIANASDERGDEQHRRDDPAGALAHLARAVQAVAPEDEHEQQEQEREPVGLLVPEQVPEDRLRVEEQRAQREREVEADREARPGRRATSEATLTARRAKVVSGPRLSRYGRAARTSDSSTGGGGGRLAARSDRSSQVNPRRAGGSTLPCDCRAVHADHRARQRPGVPGPRHGAPADRDARAGARRRDEDLHVASAGRAARACAPFVARKPARPGCVCSFTPHHEPFACAG